MMFDNLYQFWVLENLSAFITLLVGLFAFILYFLQKRDQKISAARLVFSEIRNAELKIDEIAILIDRSANDFPSVLNQNSWIKYSHLFATDFEQSELEEINHFYSNCISLEDMINKDNNFFWLNAESRTQTIQDRLYDLIVKEYKSDESEKEKKDRNEEKNKLLDMYANDWYSYAPSRTLNKIKVGIERIRRITTTPAGNKLKQIARLDIRPWYKKIF